MGDHEETFNLSYWRAVRATGDGGPFMDAFYERFLSQSSEIAEMFAATDFDTQKQMLLISLVHVASFDPVHGPDATMIRLARRHRELGISPRSYGLWLDSLLDAVKTHDPEYSEDVRESWQRVLTPGVEFMISEGSK